MYIYLFFNNFILFYCKEYVNIGQNGVSLLESTDGSIQKRHGNRVRIFTNKRSRFKRNFDIKQYLLLIHLATSNKNYLQVTDKLKVTKMDCMKKESTSY